MDILAFTKRIHEIEKEHSLFHLKDKNDLFYWDLVRHDIFYVIYYNLVGIEKVSINKESISILTKIRKFIKYYLHGLSLTRTINFDRYKYLCFSCARYKDDKNQFIDYALNDVLSMIEKEKTLIIETNIRLEGDYHYNSFFNVGPVILSVKSKIMSFVENSHELYAASVILKKEFNLDIDLDLIIRKLILKYKLEYKYYLKLLKKVKPVKIFLVQNDIQKGLFKAANDLGIKLYEVQHGLVGFIHPAYDYPNNIDITHLNSFPEAFLGFSEFWMCNVNYPVKEKISIGNSFFSQKDSTKSKVFDLAIISADIYARDLTVLLNGLISNGYKGKIALKLHPNQVNEVLHFKSHFSSFLNVLVIFDEYNIKELLSVSKTILAVQSTCVYEALDMNLKVILYRIKDYKTHKDIFENPNVYLISGSSEIEPILQKKYTENSVSYFDQFNEKLFYKLCNDSYE